MSLLRSEVDGIPPFGYWMVDNLVGSERLSRWIMACVKNECMLGLKSLRNCDLTVKWRKRSKVTPARTDSKDGGC